MSTYPWIWTAAPLAPGIFAAGRLLWAGEAGIALHAAAFLDVVADLCEKRQWFLLWEKAHATSSNATYMLNVSRYDAVH